MFDINKHEKPSVRVKWKIVDTFVLLFILSAAFSAGLLVAAKTEPTQKSPVLEKKSGLSLNLTLDDAILRVRSDAEYLQSLCRTCERVGAAMSDMNHDLLGAAILGDNAEREYPLAAQVLVWRIPGLEASRQECTVWKIKAEKILRELSWREAGP